MAVTTKYLPVYVVDPKKVDSFLWAVHDVKDDIQRKPGFRIATGIRVETIGGKRWLLTEAGYRYRMDYLRLAVPLPKPPPRPPEELVFSLAGWDGPAKRTLVQGVKWDGARFIAGQADDVTGQEEQDVWLREHREDLSYVSSFVCRKAGHGSSYGVQRVGNRTRILIGHNVLGTGYYFYGDPEFHKLSRVPNGDVTVDADNDLLCVRAGERYRGYLLSTVLNGEPEELFDTVIPDWGNRFQGHMITRLADGRVTVLVHRDMKTGGDSRVDWFILLNGEIRPAGSMVTTDAGEAEGLMSYRGFVYTTKRYGGTGPERVIRAKRTALTVMQPLTAGKVTK